MPQDVRIFCCLPFHKIKGGRAALDILSFGRGVIAGDGKHKKILVSFAADGKLQLRQAHAVTAFFHKEFGKDF